MLAALFLLAAATAAASDVPPPRTVNGEVLGSAEDFATSGPARICFASLAIDLEQNERAYLEYSGIHSSQMRITEPMGIGSFAASGGHR